MIDLLNSILQLAPLDLLLIFIPGFTIGILHTLLPCEDKTIFTFYTLGVARDTKETFRILAVYSLGLMLINLIIGSIMALIGSMIGNTILIVNEHIFNSLGASSIIISGIYIFIQVLRRKHNPHSKQEGEITETFQLREGRFRKRSSFFLGILAGLPPCVFETYIYSQAISFSASSGFINGVAIVFFYNIGSLLGLIPLSMFGIIGSYARKRLELMKKEDKSNRFQTVSIIELVSSIILIIIGTVLLILALLGINVFKLPVGIP